MQLKIEQLKTHLNKTLAPLYLIASDEPLLLMETADKIRAAARQQGYTEREMHYVEQGFDWNDVTSSLNNPSLFAGKKIIEIKLPNGKPGVTGGKILVKCAQQTPADTLIMLIVGNLEATVRNSKWYQTCAKQGACLQLWPVTPAQLPVWIKQRFTIMGMTASGEAIQLLAERVEGNLSMADQEIRKLNILFGERAISASDVLQAVADNARHDVFKFIDATLTQQTHKLSRMLGHIRAQNGKPLMVLGAIARELRLLCRVADALAQNRNPEQVMEAQRVWVKHRRLLADAARRKQPRYWRAYLLKCAKIDRIIKGIIDGDPWDELLQLSFQMSK